MKIHNCSLHLLVKNEAAFLPKLLRYISPWVDEIIVGDTGSTDDSVEIARRFTDKVYQIHLGNSFGVARNLLLSKAKREWILHIDADEWPTKTLLEWLAHFVSTRTSTLYGGVSVHRHNTVGGSDIGEMTHEWHTRLFRAARRFEGDLHEQIQTLGTMLVRAPYECVLEHFKSTERQERQNELYKEWV